MGVSRLKREDCKRTKHDPVFSKWEILIGACDWENHSLGIDGIPRYRLHNIPLICSCPGLYELGVAAVPTDLGREIRKLDSDSIVVVYLGQADNVRNRLQHYGRAGSHLNCGKSVDDSCGPGLFREIFSRGFPIVFRWVPMENKKVAERTEAQLLGVFDYSWNKGGNGDRRPNDVYIRLDAIVSRNIASFFSAKKFQVWLENHLVHQKKQGIKIKTNSLILKDARFRLKLATVKREFSQEDPVVCGLSLGDGTVCSRAPCAGRKRCETHKGKKNVGPSSRWITQGKVLVPEVTVKDESVCAEVSPHRGKSCDLREGNKISTLENPNEEVLSREVGTICGVVLNDQSICRSTPIVGRKRCSQHKGMKIYEFLRKSATEGNTISTLENPNEEVLSREVGTICGVFLNDQSICRSTPIVGRKRCSQHKGMKINELLRKSATEGNMHICGVDLGYGNACMEIPAPGRKRCEAHKGRRAAASSN